MSTAKPVTIPGYKDTQDDITEDLIPEEAAVYRRATAIINYISQDRPDLSYAIKECACANDVTLLVRDPREQCVCRVTRSY